MENIGLQDSLLSRFDLLFVMLDVADPDHDNMISEHVLRMHRYRNPKEQDGEVLPMGQSEDILSTEQTGNDDDDDDKTGDSIYERYDPLLHGNTRSRKDKILSTKFMRMYIYIARFMKPKLTEEASETIAEEYAKLRNQDLMDTDVARTQPVTARTLETMIRLATAHAKARLSTRVTHDDALAAIQLVQYAYFKKVQFTLSKDCKNVWVQCYIFILEVKPDINTELTDECNFNEGADQGEKSQAAGFVRRRERRCIPATPPAPARQEDPPNGALHYIYEFPCRFSI
ncbi:DNA replication licensing factor Mcm3 [Eumeta japonica]|uniref:DNA replication licensing factor MCM3 n=1 Tax=Eumeta variegata TaxID=151549 RepID=A0A4C1ZQH5_EUMVA|nr:DNA replication licensing factor Mcm3 [Eumeta japonica]